MYMFLFDDILLLTRVKKSSRKVRLTVCARLLLVFTSSYFTSCR